MTIRHRHLGAVLAALAAAANALAGVTARRYYNPGQSPRSPEPVATVRPRTKIETTASGAKRALNPARREKRALMREHGITTGRQWKRLRKQMKREARETEQGVEMGVAA